MCFWPWRPRMLQGQLYMQKLIEGLSCLCNSCWVTIWVRLHGIRNVYHLGHVCSQKDIWKLAMLWQTWWRTCFCMWGFVLEASWWAVADPSTGDCHCPESEQAVPWWSVIDGWEDIWYLIYLIYTWRYMILEKDSQLACPAPYCSISSQTLHWYWKMDLLHLFPACCGDMRLVKESLYPIGDTTVSPSICNSKCSDQSAGN